MPAETTRSTAETEGIAILGLADDTQSGGTRPAVLAPEPDPVVWPTTAELTSADRWRHVKARLGRRRDEQRVRPGLYGLGQPDAQSPVFVTSNYALSFDALRSALTGRHAYILVLDTLGVNVWCAAGKGTFGTDELVRRIEATGLERVVTHRRLILPQLGAPGVAAHEVKRRSGFAVTYGPIRAADLAAYLDHGITPAMRQVTFTFSERMVLAPIEVVHYGPRALLGAVVLLFLGGPWAALGVVAALLAGTVLFAALLPWLPSREFSVKGFVLGAAVAVLFALLDYGLGGQTGWVRVARAAAIAIGLTPVTAYLAFTFTGSTPITSLSGVRREMSRYLRPMVGLVAVGAILMLATAIARWIGG